MSGHSHWSGIKHKKALVDRKRGKIFSKLAKNLISAARQGGGDPEGNLKLKYAIEKARAANMPKETIERNIKKGTGEIAGESYEELIYEGYGSGGVAVLVEALTDNRNRTAPDVRKIFEKHGGKLGTKGSVMPFFEMKAVFLIEADKIDEDRLMELALEAGAEDLRNLGELLEVTADPKDFLQVKAALEEAQVPLQSAEVTYLPLNTVVLDAGKARQIIRLMEELEEHDDVQNLAANFDISEEIMAQLQQES